VRILRALGLLRPRRFDGSAELAELLEPIRGDVDVYDEVARILAPIELAEFRRLRELYRGASPSPGYSKYLDIGTYVALHLRHARELGLAPTPAAGPQRVLDIGTGAGYFPLVCKHYGHAATAIDLDTTPLFNEMVKLLCIERITWRVEAFVPLPAFPARFDCVTAMQIKFASRAQGGRWGGEEWSFFLSDLANRVAHPEAQVFLGFNADSSGAGVPKDMTRFFAEHGGRVQGWKVRFASLRSIRPVSGT
jgi:SAM-dependent methyltransferase